MIRSLFEYRGYKEIAKLRELLAEIITFSAFDILKLAIPDNKKFFKKSDVIKILKDKGIERNKFELNEIIKKSLKNLIDMFSLEAKKININLSNRKIIPITKLVLKEKYNELYKYNGKNKEEIINIIENFDKVYNEKNIFIDKKNICTNVKLFFEKLRKIKINEKTKSDIEVLISNINKDKDKDNILYYLFVDFLICKNNKSKIYLDNTKNLDLIKESENSIHKYIFDVFNSNIKHENTLEDLEKNIKETFYKKNYISEKFSLRKEIKHYEKISKYINGEFDCLEYMLFSIKSILDKSKEKIQEDIKLDLSEEKAQENIINTTDDNKGYENLIEKLVTRMENIDTIKLNYNKNDAYILDILKQDSIYLRENIKQIIIENNNVKDELDDNPKYKFVTKLISNLSKTDTDKTLDIYNNFFEMYIDKSIELLTELSESYYKFYKNNIFECTNRIKRMLSEINNEIKNKLSKNEIKEIRDEYLKNSLLTNMLKLFKKYLLTINLEIFSNSGICIRYYNYNKRKDNKTGYINGIKYQTNVYNNEYRNNMISFISRKNDYSCIIIDDKGNSFRNNGHGDGVKNTLKEMVDKKLIIYKASFPLFKGDCFTFFKEKQLLKSNESNNIFITKASFLRQMEGVNISLSLSWEQTIFDFAQFIKNNKIFNSIFNSFKYAIVIFSSEAAFLIDSDTKLLTAIFDPNRLERGFNVNTEMRVFEESSFFTATLALELLKHNFEKQPNRKTLVSGIEKSLKAVRLYKKYGYKTSKEKRFSFTIPYKKIIKKLEEVDLYKCNNELIFETIRELKGAKTRFLKCLNTADDNNVLFSKLNELENECELNCSKCKSFNLELENDKFKLFREKNNKCKDVNNGLLNDLRNENTDKGILSYENIIEEEILSLLENKKLILQNGGLSKILNFAQIDVDIKNMNTNTSKWTILDKIVLNEEDYYTLAEEIMKYGEHGKSNFPEIEFSKNLKTIDREEIESFGAIKKLITDYIEGCKNIMKRVDINPLSIAVFGQPGSGKSYSVSEIAKGIDEKSVSFMQLNLSMLDSSAKNLFRTFHRIRDITLSGKIPIVFFDEFDSSKYQWIKYFLAPMNDGYFVENEQDYNITNAIFVFAGGTAHSLDEFKYKTIENKNMIENKVPDFISRLKGFINIKGLGQASEKDNSYLIRRAKIIRSVLENTNSAKDLFYENKRTGYKELNMDNALIKAFLKIPKYKHDIRSLKYILQMSNLNGAKLFESSLLPASDQLSLHVNEDQFFSLIKNY